MDDVDAVVAEEAVEPRLSAAETPASHGSARSDLEQFGHVHFDEQRARLCQTVRARRPLRSFCWMPASRRRSSWPTTNSTYSTQNGACQQVKPNATTTYKHQSYLNVYVCMSLSQRNGKQPSIGATHSQRFGQWRHQRVE